MRLKRFYLAMVNPAYETSRCHCVPPKFNNLALHTACSWTFNVSAYLAGIDRRLQRTPASGLNDVEYLRRRAVTVFIMICQLSSTVKFARFSSSS